jgi:general secretion pathway protein C
MWKRYLWFKNLIFLCFLSYLLARIGNTILLAHLPSSQADLGLGSPAVSVEGRKAEKKSQRLYSPISQRNVFNSASTGDQKSGQDKKAGESKAPLKKADLSVELIGTVVGPSEDSFAIIEDHQSRQQELYQVDDMIQDQARVVGISRCKVVVLREGTEEVIECPEPDADKGVKTSAVRYPGSPSPASDASYNVKKVSESEYVVDEQEVENALGNINQLLTQIRVVPNFQDGKADGFKVFAIKPESIFAKVGLQNGDVIRKVNDQDITSPEKAFQVFQQLRNEKNLSVEISRRGQTQSLSYEIR